MSVRRLIPAVWRSAQLDKQSLYLVIIPPELLGMAQVLLYLNIDMTQVPPKYLINKSSGTVFGAQCRKGLCINPVLTVRSFHDTFELASD
jgi:hypothetical protein